MTDYITLNPFIDMYVEMAMLVLAQRATLMHFERYISQISCGKSEIKINKIQSEYVEFHSELLLQEVTPQQQGIETYDMLVNNLLIEKNSGKIEEKITSLYEFNTSKIAELQNAVILILALLEISNFTDFFCNIMVNPNWDFLNLARIASFVIGIAGLIGYYFIRKVSFSKKKK